MRREAERSPSQPRLARRYRRSDEVDRSGPRQARSLWQTVRGGTIDRGGRLRQATPPPPTQRASWGQKAAPYRPPPREPSQPVFRPWLATAETFGWPAV